MRYAVKVFVRWTCRHLRCQFCRQVTWHNEICIIRFFKDRLSHEYVTLIGNNRLAYMGIIHWHETPRKEEDQVDKQKNTLYERKKAICFSLFSELSCGNYIPKAFTHHRDWREIQFTRCPQARSSSYDTRRRQILFSSKITVSATSSSSVQSRTSCRQCSSGGTEYLNKWHPYICQPPLNIAARRSNWGAIYSGWVKGHGHGIASWDSAINGRSGGLPRQTGEGCQRNHWTVPGKPSKDGQLGTSSPVGVALIVKLIEP